MKRHAFTLVEMLVVIAIVVIMLAIGAVGISAMGRDTWRSAGINTVNVGVTAIRAYAGRDMGNLTAGTMPNYPGGAYSGCALVFTPEGELRLVENDQKALRHGAGSPPAATDYVEGAGLNAYKEILNREPVLMPKSAGVMGVIRTPAGLQFLPPPFAMRFDQNGQLVAADAAGNADAIYYDGNCDGDIDDGTVRTAGYNLRDWDPTLGGSAVTFDSTAGRYTLPFEGMEAVLVLLVYDKAAFLAQFPGAIPSVIDDGSTEGQWLLQDDGSGELRNGRMIHFSRYTGAVLKELAP